MLNGKTISLKPIDSIDIDTIMVWRNNLEVKSGIMSHPFPVTKEMEVEWYNKVISSKESNIVYFKIVLNKGNICIGYVLLNNVNYINSNAYLGIVIGDEINRGKGYAKETMELLLDYAFNYLNLNKILLEVNEENTPAVKLYKRLGFAIEGNLKENYFSKGKYHNILIMSIFKNR